MSDQFPEDTRHSLGEKTPHAGSQNVPEDVREVPINEYSTSLDEAERQGLLETPEDIGELSPEELELIRQRREQESLQVPDKHSRKKRYIAGGVATALAAGGIVFAATRGSSDNAVAQPSPSASGTPTPGPSASETTPAPTPSTEVSPTTLPTLTETLPAGQSLNKLRSMDISTLEVQPIADRLKLWSSLNYGKDQFDTLARAKARFEIDKESGRDTKFSVVVEPSLDNSNQEIMNWFRNNLKHSIVNMRTTEELVTNKDLALQNLTGVFYNTDPNSSDVSRGSYLQQKEYVEGIADGTMGNFYGVFTAHSGKSVDNYTLPDGKKIDDVREIAYTYEDRNQPGRELIANFAPIKYIDFEGKPRLSWVLIESHDL